MVCGIQLYIMLIQPAYIMLIQPAYIMLIQPSGYI